MKKVTVGEEKLRASVQGRLQTVRGVEHKIVFLEEGVEELRA
ncbi:MAG: hypothetical protein ACE5KH_03535 [Candidatus Geothermarchaeales archaeon]